MSRTRTRLSAGFGTGGTMRRKTTRTGGISSMIQGAPGTAATSTIVDQPHTHDQPFTVTSKSFTGVVNGSWSKSDTTFCQLSNWLLPVQNPAHISDPSVPADPALAVQVLRRTNPSKSKIDVPSAVFELRDMPHLLKGAGDRWFKQGGNAYLAAQFALAPLISDFRKLLQFKESTDKRVKLFKKLAEGPMLRKVSLGTYVVSSGRASDGFTVQSTPGFFIDLWRQHTTTQRKVWGYVTWSPTDSFQKLVRDDDALLRKAKAVVGGYNPDSMTALKNLWNVLPWSWMADWCSDLGDYIEAHQNSVPLTHGIPRICRQTTTIAVWNVGASVLHPEGGYSQCQDGTCEARLVDKSRALASASLPSASLPFLTARQIGILTSLNVTRFPSRFR